MRIYGTVKNAKGEKGLPKTKISLFINKEELAVIYSDKEGKFEHNDTASYVGETLTCKVEKEGYQLQGTFRIEEEEVPLKLEMIPVPAPEKSKRIKKSKKCLSVCIGSAALLIIAAVVLVFPRLTFFKPEAIKPRIIFFKAKPASVKKGESSTLTWKITNADEVLLDGKTMFSNTKRLERLSNTRTYTLTAKNGRQSVCKSTKIIVENVDPIIKFFTADKTKLEGGDRSDSTFLRWEVAHATGKCIWIEPGIGMVKPKDERRISPRITTMYTIYVCTDRPKIWKSIKIEVVNYID
jgi:hypothetical protein